MAGARKKKQSAFEAIAAMQSQGVLKQIDETGQAGTSATASSDAPSSSAASASTASEQSHQNHPASEAAVTPHPAQDTNEPSTPALPPVTSVPAVVADTASTASEQSHQNHPASEAAVTPPPAQDTNEPSTPASVVPQQEQSLPDRSTAVSVPPLNFDAIEAIAEGSRPVITSSLPYSPATTNVDALPGGLRTLLQDRPVYYGLLGRCYAAAIQARTARVKHKKKSLRIYQDLAHALTVQNIQDKRELKLAGLVVSHYVDAALTVGRGAETTDQLLELAHQERDDRIADVSENHPNHYTLSPTNAAWIDEVTDDMRAVGSKGMQAYLVNALVRHFLANLSNERARGAF